VSSIVATAPSTCCGGAEDRAAAIGFYPDGYVRATDVTTWQDRRIGCDCDRNTMVSRLIAFPIKLPSFFCTSHRPARDDKHGLRRVLGEFTVRVARDRRLGEESC
jgi:hypothetical protein